jgi:DeoR family transcriptional regulator, deoxyribose operon repressor
VKKKEARINRLIDLLKARNLLPISELADMLEVSEMTIRRDLAVLNQKNIARNAGGNALYNPSHDLAVSDHDYNLYDETEKQNLQKYHIGRYAASLIEKDDIIIIDTGTTTEKIAPHIPNNLNITVLTYNTNILISLYPKTGIHLLFAGGHFHPKTQMFESPEGISFINGVRANKVFISAAGIHRELGITCVNNYEVPTKQAVLKSSLQKILVADSSKFDKIRPAYFCNLHDLTAVITDKEISTEWKEYIESRALHLHIVPEEQAVDI